MQLNGLRRHGAVQHGATRAGDASLRKPSGRNQCELGAIDVTRNNDAQIGRLCPPQEPARPDHWRRVPQKPRGRDPKTS